MKAIVSMLVVLLLGAFYCFEKALTVLHQDLEYKWKCSVFRSVHGAAVVARKPLTEKDSFFQIGWERSVSKRDRAVAIGMGGPYLEGSLANYVGKI